MLKDDHSGAKIVKMTPGSIFTKVKVRRLSSLSCKHNHDPPDNIQNLLLFSYFSISFYFLFLFFAFVHFTCCRLFIISNLSNASRYATKV